MNGTLLIRSFLISLGGVVSDYITTTIGLGIGLSEKNPFYSPFGTIMVLWTSLVILALSLPKGRTRRVSISALALASYFAATHNLLVILIFVAG